MYRDPSRDPGSAPTARKMGWMASAVGSGRDGGDLRGAARVGVDRVGQRAVLPGREDAHRHCGVAAGRPAGARRRRRPQRRVRDLTRGEADRTTRRSGVLGVAADLVAGDVDIPSLCSITR